MRKITRAASIARFDGWTIGLFAVLTLLLGLGSLPTVALGAAMGCVAFVELRTAARLRRLDAAAARTLGLNQLALATALVLYAVWAMHQKQDWIAEIAAADPQAAEVLGSVKDLADQLMKLIYWGVIAVAIFGQGGLAWFYFTRGRHIRAYLARTPPWIVAMQQAGIAA